MGRGKSGGASLSLTLCFYKDREIKRSIYTCLILVIDIAAPVILVSELFNIFEISQNLKVILNYLIFKI